MSLIKRIFAYSGIFLIIVGGIVLLVKPFPSCGSYVNLIVTSYCGSPITVLGLDPNIFTSVIMVPLGMAALIGAVRLR